LHSIRTGANAVTEQEWLNCNDPMPMLEYLKEKTSERKLRLFACACCRRIWSALKRGGSRKAVEVCEMYADKLATGEKLKAAHDSAHDAFARVQWAAESDEETTPARAAIYLGGGTDFHANLVAGEAAATFGVKAREWDYKRRKRATDTKGQEAPIWDQYDTVYLAAQAEEARTQTHLLRCVIGNPFRPATATSSWFTSDVVSLATGIYQERAFDRMPILADALQDAGCDNADILNHCRSEAPHVRGCWVIDLLLGKE
jgi:hypothetical protein